METLKKVGRVLLKILVSDAFIRSALLIMAFVLFMLMPMKDAIFCCAILLGVMICIPTVKNEKGILRWLTLALIIAALVCVFWTLAEAVMYRDY